MHNRNSQQRASHKPSLSINKSSRIPLSLHRYIWVLVGVWGLFLVSFPVAYIRVAQSEKFGEQPLKSINWSENQKDNLVYPEKE